MKNFLQLKNNLKKDFSSLKQIRVALLGDTATQFLTLALRGAGYDRGFDLTFFEADFDQVERQILDPESELHHFKPELVFVFQSSHKLLNTYNKLSFDHNQLASERVDLIDALYKAVSVQLESKLIYFNYTEIDDAVFGSYANKLNSSFLYQVRKLNYELMNYAALHPDFYICDLSSIQNLLGKNSLFRPSIYVNSEMVIAVDTLPLVASRTLDIVDNLYGKIKKCLILDLDNTIWGGIIGDDGIENIQIGALGIGKAFTEFQQWIKKLKDRGVIIAVCSKNTESVAKEVFEKHPDMVLKLQDIAVFVANWENKVDNIRYIQSVLNIRFDAMVFLDDNPFERNIVRENIKDLSVPELPEDPADYLEFLYTLNLFETNSFSREDKERTRLYQEEAKRSVLLKSFTNEEEFLKNLEMTSLVEPFTKFNIPRVSQLSQRSNQFNLRSIRYTEAELERISNSPDSFSFSFSLKDKFGDNGLICVVLLKKENDETLFIDSWFMSCRVLKRSMEHFVFNTVLEFAKAQDFKVLKGEYIMSSKNAMVKDHYEKLGFINSNNYWVINTENYKEKITYIDACKTEK